MSSNRESLIARSDVVPDLLQFGRALHCYDAVRAAFEGTSDRCPEMRLSPRLQYFSAARVTAIL